MSKTTSERIRFCLLLLFPLFFLFPHFFSTTKRTYYIHFLPHVTARQLFQHGVQIFGITEFAAYSLKLSEFLTQHHNIISNTILNACRPSTLLKHSCAFIYACLSIINVRFLATKNLERLKGNRWRTMNLEARGILICSSDILYYIVPVVKQTLHFTTRAKVIY